MRIIMVAFAVAALMLTQTTLAGPASAQQVAEEEYVFDGVRILEQSIKVPASAEELWRLFTTGEGLMSWSVPMAKVEFGVGGVWESSYNRSARPGDPANIRNRYVAFLPHRMIVIRAEQAPPDFPAPALLDELVHVIEFEEVDGESTRVSISGVGYGKGEAWDAIYNLFRGGNRWTLEQLHQRVTEGPVNWSDVDPGAGGAR